MSGTSRSNAIRAFIKSKKADSVFFVPGAHGGRYSVHDLLYRQAELALAAGQAEKTLALLRVYLKKTKDLRGNQVQLYTAASLTGQFPLALKAAKELENASLSAGQRIDIANPWYRVHDKALLAGLLAALEGYRPGTRTFHHLACLFMLRSMNGIDDRPTLKLLMAGFRGEPRGAFRRHIWLYFKIAEAALHHCHFAQAEKIFSRILREEPGLENAAGRLAEALLCAGKKDAAFKTLEKASNYHKVSMEVWQGEMQLWLGQYGPAGKKLRDGAAAGHQLAWCWLGAALFKLGEKDEAALTLTKALELRPEDNEARIWLSEALASRGKVKAAEAQLKAALKINPLDFWAGLSLAALYTSNGKTRKGLILKMPPEVLSRLAAEAGLPEKDDYSAPELKLLLYKARELAKGIRRNEGYLRALWLGGQVSQPK